MKRSKMEKRVSLEWFSAFGGPEVPALWVEVSAGGNSGLRPEVPAKRENG